MRLRTGDPEVDALTPDEVGKAGKFFLIMAGVNEKENLSKAERNTLAELTRLLVETYRRKLL